MEISAHSEPFLFVNDKRCEIPRECDPEMSLNDFLREVLELTGTKVMCREAGCGCCIVCAVYKHPATGEIQSKPVNSCITPLYSAVGWHVVTTEGIGGAKSPAGYHPIQSRLADGFGSQCGYCSPGFVMSAYSQLRDNPKPTELEVEHFFDGNICRCTGYRPILDAMKTFACDSAKPGCLDVEDLERGCCRSKVGKVPTSGLGAIARGWKGQKFYNPGSLHDLLTLLGRVRSDNYRLVLGNTSAGVFKEDALADHYINVRNVSELYLVEESDAGLEVGANVSLHELSALFLRVSAGRPGLAHLAQMSRHLQQVANQAVRRSAGWAGNLMLKHAHPEFPSDLFVLMEAARAVVKVTDAVAGVGGGGVQECTLTDFLRLDMRGRLIVSAVLPAVATEMHRYGSFKVTPRTLNSHAYLNAAFHFSVDSANGYSVTERPSIVYGGVSGKFNHAVKTENFLQNRSLLDQETVSGAMKVLESELTPAEEATWSSPQHRRALAANLLYKFILGVAKDALVDADASGGDVLERRTQASEQDFEEPPATAAGPLGRAVPKQEARAQTAGEAQYVNDAPARRNELFGAFVLSTEAPATLKGFNIEEAEQVLGFDRLITAKDLEGRFDNNYVSALIPPQFAQTEEVLVTTAIRYAGQPLAIVLATSQRAADRAAALVVADFEQTGEPITSVAEAVAKGSVVMETPEETVGSGDIAKELGSQPCTVEGQLVINEQVHFAIETLTAEVTPCEEGLLISVPHQWVDALVLTLCRVLRRPANQLRVVTPRIGGGFGGKLIMSDMMAAATAIAAEIAGRPVRMYLTLGANMALAMKRPGMLLKYRGAADAGGKLRAGSWEINNEVGYTVNMQAMIADELKHTLDMGYMCPNYSMRVRHMRTDKPESTFVRGPGPAVSSLANLLFMDHLAFEAGLDPIEFKYNNLYKDGDFDILGNKREGDNFQRMWHHLAKVAEIDQRRADITEFNKSNTFRKRGLDMTAVSYHISYDRGRPSQVFVAVQAADGSVTVTHSGAEMGQGLGVKCAQAVASTLGIELAAVKLKPTDSHVVPNNDVTGGSSTSEWNCQAAVDAAEQINGRLAAIRKANPQDGWADLVRKAVAAGISLAVMGTFNSDNAGRRSGRYCSTGVGAVEAEVDILTGQYQIRRADIMMDVGRSMNPGVDVGQIEGAFVMGMGYYLMERTVYDPDSGRNLTDSTWEYKVPQAADTPRDFRVHLLRESPNAAGAMGAKAVGEPPICLAPLCVTAIKRAVEAFRSAAGKPRKHLTFDMPLTPERVLMLCDLGEEDRRVCQK